MKNENIVTEIVKTVMGEVRKTLRLNGVNDQAYILKSSEKIADYFQFNFFKKLESLNDQELRVQFFQLAIEAKKEVINICIS